MSEDSGKRTNSGIAWSPLVAILLTIATFIVSQLVVGLGFGLVFGVLDWNSQQSRDWMSTSFGQFAMIAVGSLVTVSVLWWFLRARRVKFSVLGFSRWPHWRDVALSLLGFTVYFGLLIAASIVASQIFGINTEQEQEIGFETAKSGGQGLLWVFLSLVVLPPLVEEVLFRGFLFGSLRAKLSFQWAVVITSILFAIPHLFASSDGFLWIAGVDTFVLSLVLCYLREKTGALWASIALHAIKNSLAFIFIFVV
ncbi:MAG TPA: CPBP family intramembrane glutamic endopeptidase [Candidatus Saccharimonadales bacterium]|nr:CPBP family intramembrane glutamic endopeptidase [Candidatus Saccharimonadales bacterium]